MYKVFMNDKSIILFDSSEEIRNELIYHFDPTRLKTLLSNLKKTSSNNLYLRCDDLKKDWIQFKKCFKVVEAAGGKVLNSSSKEVLFIYRFGKWDLPKGKLEAGESVKDSALREVEEECGLSNLKIDRELEITYHIYEHYGYFVLKVTHWFLMHSFGEQTLSPQREEGIEQVAFKDDIGIKEALKNTYENIKLLFC